MNEILEIITINPNRVLDFGPPRDFPVLCRAFTVEKVCLWQQQTEELLRLIPLQGKGMPSGRAEGVLYSLSDRELYGLDKEHEVGVCFQRKRLPVYLPFRDDTTMLQTYAYVYIGVTGFWVDKIDFDQNFKYGTHRGKEFSLVDRYPDPDPLLNFRYKFIPPEISTNGHNLHVPEAVIKNVKKRNRGEMRRMNFQRMRHGVQYFLNDDNF